INQGIVLGEDGEKMSKSKGNVVNPDDIVEKYGADTLRVYEMFMGPFEDMKPWNDQNILGVYRFLEKIFVLFEMRFNSKKKTDVEFKEKVSTESLERSIHKAIKKVSSDIEEVKFNTAISCLMELVNDFYKYKNFIDVIPEKYFENLVLLLAPFAPFLSEELWMESLKKKKTIHKNKWPEFDEKLIVDKKVRIVIQINGKVRDNIEVNKDITQEMLEEKVMSLKKINTYLEGQKIKKVIYIDNKLINFVI
ncbi:MAG: class I tRNA ligase family protein, partial [Candidatus Pacebacteria bacterium]|nr:class I tRNA ligase family protein [Candidatus Paceibacterota bacterium]